MPELIIRSAAGQVAAYLSGEVLAGRWLGVLPGVDRLARDLGVNRKTVESALRQMELEGLLEGQGPGRRRRIVLPDGHRMEVHPLRVAILLGDSGARREDYIVDLQHTLVEAGHRAFFATKSLGELGRGVTRIHRLVEKTEADAWVVGGGSREVLEWFSSWPEPSFALFGRMAGLPMPGAKPDKATAYIEATRHLVGLGHRRIALLCRRARRVPEPGRPERAFLNELALHGQTSPYNLPDWHDTIDGFQELLDGLFRVTPPTALLVDEAHLFIAALQFLGRQGIRVPEDLSLVCTDDDSSFAWCQPTIAHIRWDRGPVVRRILRWTNHVAQGKPDRRQTFTRARFVPGGTAGKVPAG